VSVDAVKQNRKGLQPERRKVHDPDIVGCDFDTQRQCFLCGEGNDSGGLQGTFCGLKGREAQESEAQRAKNERPVLLGESPINGRKQFSLVD